MEGIFWLVCKRKLQIWGWPWFFVWDSKTAQALKWLSGDYYLLPTSQHITLRRALLFNTPSPKPIMCNPFPTIRKAVMYFSHMVACCITEISCFRYCSWHDTSVTIQLWQTSNLTLTKKHHSVFLHCNYASTSKKVATNRASFLKWWVLLELKMVTGKQNLPIARVKLLHMFMDSNCKKYLKLQNPPEEWQGSRNTRPAKICTSFLVCICAQILTCNKSWC